MTAEWPAVDGYWAAVVSISGSVFVGVSGAVRDAMDVVSADVVPKVVEEVYGLAEAVAVRVGTIKDISTSCTSEVDPDVAADANSKGVPSAVKCVLCGTSCVKRGCSTPTGLAAGSHGLVG